MLVKKEAEVFLRTRGEPQSWQRQTAAGAFLSSERKAVVDEWERSPAFATLIHIGGPKLIVLRTFRWGVSTKTKASATSVS